LPTSIHIALKETLNGYSVGTVNGHVGWIYICSGLQKVAEVCEHVKDSLAEAEEAAWAPIDTF
jgi:hypothetical protein